MAIIQFPKIPIKTITKKDPFNWLHFAPSETDREALQVIKHISIEHSIVFKRSASVTCKYLAYAGWIMLGTVTAVSSVHAYATLGAIGPVPVAVPEWLHNASSIAITATIDLVAVFIALAVYYLTLARLTAPIRTMQYNLFLVFMLNFVYVAKYNATYIGGFFAPVFNELLTFAIPFFVPLNIYAIKNATQLLALAKEKLSTEASYMKGMIDE